MFSLGEYEGIVGLRFLHTLLGRTLYIILLTDIYCTTKLYLTTIPLYCSTKLHLTLLSCVCPVYVGVDGSVDFNTLLDLLNQTPQTAINVKSEILQTVLGVFQLDSSKKALFREVSGFHYLISVLASLIGSLDPHRVHPWTIGNLGLIGGVKCLRFFQGYIKG